MHLQQPLTLPLYSNVDVWKSRENADTFNSLPAKIEKKGDGREGVKQTAIAPGGMAPDGFSDKSYTFLMLSVF